MAVISERSIWHDVYGIGKDTTSISNGAAASKGIALTNHPTFDPGQNHINQRKAVGTSYRRAGTGYEFQVATQSPTTTWEFDVCADNISFILWSLFQNGASEAAGSPYVKYFIPYEPRQTDASDSVYTDCEVWLSLVRKLAASGDAGSHRIIGAIARSITFSATEGENLKASVEFIGYSHSTVRNIASDTLTMDAVAPLLWQNATVELGGNTTNIPGFSLTISNNAVVKFNNAGNPQKFILGEFTAEGTISIPWATTTEGGNTAMDDFVAGNTDRLAVYWGVGGEIATTDLDFSILAHIRRTAASMVGDDEILTEIPFICVSEEQQSAVNPASSTITTAASSSLTGTSTTFNSFDKGDILYPFGCTSAADRMHRLFTAIAGNEAATIYPAFGTTNTSKPYRICSSPLTITLADGTDAGIGSPA